MPAKNPGSSPAQAPASSRQLVISGFQRSYENRESLLNQFTLLVVSPPIMIVGVLKMSGALSIPKRGSHD
jgi:hypothetical protein